MKRTESCMNDYKLDGMLLNKRSCTLEQNLKTLLSKKPYTFKEAFYGDSPPPSSYRWDDLKSSLHATDEELKSALSLVSALEIDGYWRVADDDCISQWIYYLISESSLREWSLNSLDANQVVTVLQLQWGFSPVFSRNCLEFYARTTDEGVFVFDTKKAYVKLAQIVLHKFGGQHFGGQMTIQDYIQHLSNVGMPVNLDLLEDEILVHKDGDQDWVYLPSDDHYHPNSISLKSAVQAYAPDDPLNPIWFYMSDSDLDQPLEDLLKLPPNVSNQRDEDDSRTMEQKLKAYLENPRNGLCGWDELKRTLDATDEELKSTLSLVSAVEIDGLWTIYDDLTIDMVLYHLLLEAESYNWSFSSLDGNIVVKSLVCNYGFCNHIIRHCLELYASTVDGKVWELNTERVCVELARGVIKKHGERLKIQDFINKWIISVRMPVSLDMLEEEILVEKDGDEAWVHLSSVPHANSLTSVSQAFPPDHLYRSRVYKPSMGNGESRYHLSEFEIEGLEVQSDYVCDDSGRVKDDAGTMEQRLRTLLLKNPYTLDEDIKGVQKSGLYQWDDIKSMLNANDEELKSALMLVSALEINGHWRIVDDICIGQVLHYLVWMADTNDWSFSSLDVNKIVKSLGDTWGCPSVLARHCLEMYARTADGRVWELDIKRVCVELARWVIKSNGKRMEISYFMPQWSCAGLPVSLDMLEGEVLVKHDGNFTWLYLPSDNNGNTLTSVSQETH